MTTIFILEDDPNICEIETIALKNSNYAVKTFERASKLYASLQESLPDLILLDVMLPDEDGFSVVRKLRSSAVTRRIPVIMVTAKTTEIDLIRGLDDGADDYIRKPFSVLELISRVKAMLRRTCDEALPLSVGAIRLDNAKRLVTVDGKPVELTFKEFELLQLLMKNANKVVSREEIHRLVWGTNFDLSSRTVDMHIKTLRQKLETYSSLIRTVRNVGYTINTSVQNEIQN